MSNDKKLSNKRIICSQKLAKELGMKHYELLVLIRSCIYTLDNNINTDIYYKQYNKIDKYGNLVTGFRVTRAGINLLLKKMGEK